ncbi:phage baseplate assembly protein [Enterovibrio baiacu]|uniref:phage baseplate assembly protein n=1 Tax=Enterovibrio baiacu TaxID=2491023 RepID=UPI003D15019C
MDKVSLKIGGRVWQGWKQVSTTRALSAVTGEHQFSITRSWQDAEALPLREGMAVEVFVGEDKVATGYIAERVPSYDANTLSYHITARCKTKDLVESSLVHPSGEWKHVTLATLAAEICRPYGIAVEVQTDIGGPFITVRLEQGESPFELLERLARQRGVLLTSNANGNLVIARASDIQLHTALVLGQNILAARGRFSESERFSQYIIKGVGNGAAFDAESPARVGGQSVSVNDNDITRYRPKIILSEEVFTADGASRRGQWQKQRALAHATTTEITVQGWRMPNGMLWPLNRLIKVLDPIQGIDDVLLIASLTRLEDDQGRTTVLGLVPPNAMDIPIETAKDTLQVAAW